MGQKPPTRIPKNQGASNSTAKGALEDLIMSADGDDKRRIQSRFDVGLRHWRHAQQIASVAWLLAPPCLFLASC